ncbi:helix-turn-helix transcriptional regulator [Streptomonospora sp. S1-112]|uniref:Helix-turn-helix transcriptional regulator n=1 Tax=Streptomonospora mangrovi TaxID=2883123 RepID=A0A9X3NRM9_9ACTN|nr:helix-turn-helix transcriptional regulator [Streptomonospora mangrovi]MDA0566814.1 helix-turn-helix transcriptional regulator [Streptomonospora mangrovi]
MPRTDLGDALRAWRDRLTPESVGLPSGARRRAPGLRREELSQLAGVSADYIVRLEQGRAHHPSPQITEALARALRLDRAQREHLFHLAGLAAPGAAAVPRGVTPAARRILERMSGCAVAVYDPAWTLLLANPLYDALMGRWSGDDRNAVWRAFVSAATRVRHTPESNGRLRRLLAADLRRTAARYPDDPKLRDLVARLRAGSAAFAHLWDSGAAQEHQDARKTVDHPEAGPITVDCDVLHVAGDDLRVMVYSAAPGTGDAERLALLSAAAAPGRPGAGPG